MAIRPTYRLTVTLALLALVTACGGDAESSAAAAAPVTIDWSDVRQPISGFGASSAWTATNLTDELADQLFSVEQGVGLSFLRLRITPNGTSDELPTAEQAQARGARVWAAPWTPPGAWKVNTRSNPLYGGSLTPENYPSWADRLAGFVESCEAQGIALFGLSVQNEPGYVNNWETCEWSPEQLAQFTRDHLIPALAARGLSTPLIAPESNSWNNLAEYAEPLLADPTTRDAIGFVATHSYGGRPYAYGTASDHGKELWQTEVSEDHTEGPDPGMISALWVARMMHDALTIAQVSAWHYWWLLPRSDVPELGNSALLLGGTLTRRAYVMGNFSKFVRPGSVRLGTSTANPSQGVFVTAYRNAAATEVVLVAINVAELATVLSFAVAGKTLGDVAPWVTSDALALMAQPPISGGSEFSYELPARSVTTFVASVAP